MTTFFKILRQTTTSKKINYLDLFFWNIFFKKVGNRCAECGFHHTVQRKALKKRHIEPIIPARCNNKVATDQDGRKLRRYRRRWIVEQSIGWLGNFSRLTVRWDRNIGSYAGFFHLACALIVLRRVLK